MVRRAGKASMRISIPGIWSNNIKKKSLIGNNGFTLLELSLVILVIGMVLALVLPNLKIPKSKLDRQRDIENISQTIKYLYNLAQVKNEEILLLFDLDKNELKAISLLEGEDKEENILSTRRISSYLKVQDIINSEGNKITEGITPLIFHPSGFVGPVTIHFIDEKEKSYTLFVNPLTGQSHIELGYLQEYETKIQS